MTGMVNMGRVGSVLMHRRLRGAMHSLIDVARVRVRFQVCAVFCISMLHMNLVLIRRSMNMLIIVLRCMIVMLVLAFHLILTKLTEGELPPLENYKLIRPSAG